MTTTGTSSSGRAEKDGPFLSKSKFLWGLQCHKLLWHAYNAKHLIPEPDASQQAIFDQGHEVGALAKRLFADGIEVGEGVTDLDDKLGDMFKTIRLPAHPAIAIGPHCDDPYPCSLHDRCWSFLPEQSVLDLYRGTKKGFGLLESGITHLRDIPDGFKLTANQVVQRQAAITGQAHVSPQAISEFLDRLKYPLHFYYHPAQGGSASMKAVLPALTGKGYGNLAIQEGDTASREFLRVTFGNVPEDERRRVRKQLEQYCGQDTEGMIWIVDALADLKGR